MAQNIRLNGSPMMACAQRAVREMPDGQTLTDPVVIYFRGGEYDYERGAKAILDDFRKGRTGRITLDDPAAFRL